MVALASEEVAPRKAREVDTLTAMIDANRVVAVASLYKVRAIQIQELRRKLSPGVQLRVTKNTLTRMAFKKSGRPNFEKLSDHLTGSNVLFFTNMNPFRLYLLLGKNRVKMTVKAGDVAPNDIVVPEGNTGLPPGPVISELSEVGIRTRIETGSVWVVRDTVVAKKGEKILPKLASVLSRLGIKPLEVGLTMVASCMDSLIIPQDQLRLEPEEIERQLATASVAAFNLAVNASYVIPQTAILILAKAAMSARNLAVNAAYPAREVTPEILRRAYYQALSLATRLVQIKRDAAPPGLVGR